MGGGCAELDHPADLWLEIWAEDLPRLFENALYAFYRQLVEVETVEPRTELTLQVAADSVETTLRVLLAEALFRFETEGFLAAGGVVTVATGSKATPDGPPSPDPTRVGVTARLAGETADEARHTLLTEIKAVTYHGLTAVHTREGPWRATVLFDV